MCHMTNTACAGMQQTRENPQKCCFLYYINPYHWMEIHYFALKVIHLQFCLIFVFLFFIFFSLLHTYSTAQM